MPGWCPRRTPLPGRHFSGCYPRRRCSSWCADLGCSGFVRSRSSPWRGACSFFWGSTERSEEHTSELQSHRDLHSFPTRRSFRSAAVLVVVRGFGVQRLRAVTLIPLAGCLFFLLGVNGDLLDLNYSARPLAREMAVVAPNVRTLACWVGGANLV